LHQPSRQDESLLQRWRRRAVTIPLYFALFFLTLVSLPVVLGLTAVIDAIRGSRWALSRCALFFVFYLAWNFRVQCWWAQTLFAGARHLFGVRLAVKGLEPLGTGPILLLQRHASIGDTAQEIAAVRRLTEDMGPEEGVFICPEGTRFTPERQRAAEAAAVASR
jgi:hypothetical protein